MKQEKIIFNPDNSGFQRLDQFLIASFPSYSRSYFQKLISMGMVFIDNKPAKKPSQKLQFGDQIRITFAPTHEFSLEPQNIPLDIIFEHPDFLVINKPAGLLVHPASTTPAGEKTLVGALLHHFQDFISFDDIQRPGIIHRLDKDTSGIILVARNPSAHNSLSKLFKDRLIKKNYLALVRGEPPKTGTISYPIGRHPYERHKMSHVGVASRDACTHYTTIDYFDDYALVEASPVTGRTHQIRVHFAAIGHGLIGDTVYGFVSKQIKRHALHAYKLSFSYNGKEFSFTAPLPSDFSMLLQNKQTE